MTLRERVEALLDLAHGIYENDPELQLDAEFGKAGHSRRVAELIVAEAERLAQLAGISKCRVPPDFRAWTDLEDDDELEDLPKRVVVDGTWITVVRTDDERKQLTIVVNTENSTRDNDGEGDPKVQILLNDASLYDGEDPHLVDGTGRPVIGPQPPCIVCGQPVIVSGPEPTGHTHTSDGGAIHETCIEPDAQEEWIVTVNPLAIIAGVEPRGQGGMRVRAPNALAALDAYCNHHGVARYSDTAFSGEEEYHDQLGWADFTENIGVYVLHAVFSNHEVYALPAEAVRRAIDQATKGEQVSEQEIPTKPYFEGENSAEALVRLGYVDPYAERKPNKEAALAWLKEHGYVRAEIQYHGGNDEGGAENIALYRSHDPSEQPDTELRYSDDAWVLLCAPIDYKYGSFAGDFYCSGTVTYDVEAGTCVMADTYEEMQGETTNYVL